jgi:hypothetical protein
MALQRWSALSASRTICLAARRLAWRLYGAACGQLLRGLITAFD